jgi:NADH-quinone oxidoreductase subunit C
MTDAQKLFESLKSESGEAVRSVEGQGDDTRMHVAPAAAHEVLRSLKERHGFNVLVDVTAVDRTQLTGDAGPRFEVTYRLLALDAMEGLSNGRVALKVRLADGEALPRSAMDLWPAADWLEREVWDMFGIKVADRPDMKRLLMYEEFQGHPLRKDYAIQKRQPLIGPAAGEREDNPSFNHAVPTVTAD